MLTTEQQRLEDHRQHRANWRLWGPYLSERAWGTVREDYSANGDAWGYFSHDQARSRAYRWNEDGLAGISDRSQFLCFALALWNEQDAILKERLFGLTGPEGNHGEDVKEYYFYQDNTPTHSYMRMLYKYPQSAFPYSELVEENRRRGFADPEYELLDTGVFADNRYFDVEIEYAKASEDDILIRLSVTNRGTHAAACHLLPTLWFRNTWSWGYPAGPMGDVAGRPLLHRIDGPEGSLALAASHPAAGDYFLYAEDATGLLVTENESNNQRLWGVANATPFVKDAFHRYLINDERAAINPAERGTKAAVHYRRIVPAGETRVIRLRLSAQAQATPFAADFTELFAQRKREADEFYAAVQNPGLSEDERSVQRQALAGMLWSKQLFYYDVQQWLQGDPSMPPPPDERRHGRNRGWDHLNNFDVISMPDAWEYPWYATWDLAFHTIPFALIDPDFAKRQLTLVTREWYMHPNGALPAYEWSFGDVNPPVHAWATWRVYKIDGKQSGVADRAFLEGVFHKLLLNFTWWVNRKDRDGNNVFQGGFLGLDNISVFNRSARLPTGGHIDQSDGTAWMGFASLMMLKIALELARKEPVYQDIATKFFEHFLRIGTAINGFGDERRSLWDEQDGFFYDVLHLPGDRIVPLRVRSLVGLMPLIAVETIEPHLLRTLTDFHRRARWFLKNRPDLAETISRMDVSGSDERYCISLLTPERLRRVLGYMLDENEFLSPYGIRSLSKYHEKNPYRIEVEGEVFQVSYEPAESQTGLFGGNSNWRGPVWFPINFLIIEALQRYHHYLGDSFTVEFPTGSGHWVALDRVAAELSTRLTRIFLRNGQDERPVFGGMRAFQDDPDWRDNLLFYEYFHGESGAGLGASHQTGWTGLVAKLLQQKRGSPMG